MPIICNFYIGYFELTINQVLKESAFVYTVDMDVKKLLHLEPRTWDFISRLEPKLGLIEYMQDPKAPTDLLNMLDKGKIKVDGSNPSNGSARYEKRPRVAIVGSGPSGLFAALVLAEVGADVTLIERGQPVEQRGRDIGALVVRRVLSSESNFCFGEVCSPFLFYKINAEKPSISS